MIKEPGPQWSQNQIEDALSRVEPSPEDDNPARRAEAIRQIARDAADAARSASDIKGVVISDYTVRIVTKTGDRRQIPRPLKRAHIEELTSAAIRETAESPDSGHQDLTQAHGHADMALGAYDLITAQGASVIYATREDDGEYALLTRSEDSEVPVHTWTTATERLAVSTLGTATTDARASFIAQAARKTLLGMGIRASDGRLVHSNHQIRISAPLNRLHATGNHGLVVEIRQEKKFVPALRYSHDTADLLTFREGVWTVYVQHMAVWANRRAENARLAPHRPGPDDFSPLNDLATFEPEADRAENISIAVKTLLSSEYPRQQGYDRVSDIHIDPEETMQITINWNSETIEICLIDETGKTGKPVYAAHDGEYGRPEIHSPGPWEIDLLSAAADAARRGKK